MRTTICLDDDLVRDAKEVAKASGRSLNQLIEEALRESLLRRRALRGRQPVKLHTFGRGGIRPGVDISNSAALLDILEPPEEIRPRLGIHDVLDDDSS